MDVTTNSFTSTFSDYKHISLLVQGNNHSLPFLLYLQHHFMSCDQSFLSLCLCVFLHHLTQSGVSRLIQRETQRGRCRSNYTVVLRLSGCNKEEIIKGGVLMDGGCISSIWQPGQLLYHIPAASFLAK